METGKGRGLRRGSGSPVAARGPGSEPMPATAATTTTPKVLRTDGTLTASMLLQQPTSSTTASLSATETTATTSTGWCESSGEGGGPRC